MLALFLCWVIFLDAFGHHLINMFCFGIVFQQAQVLFYGTLISPESRTSLRIAGMGCCDTVRRLHYNIIEEGKRYSLNLPAYNRSNLAASMKVMLQIELDTVSGNFDESLVKYGAKEVKVKVEHPKTLVRYFEIWVSNYKQLDCDKNSDYFHLKNTLRKWGEIAPSGMLQKLNTENYGPKRIMSVYPCQTISNRYYDWYNNHRKHGSLGRKSPEQFLQLFNQKSMPYKTEKIRYCLKF